MKSKKLLYKIYVKTLRGSKVFLTKIICGLNTELKVNTMKYFLQKFQKRLIQGCHTLRILKITEASLFFFISGWFYVFL